MPSTIEYYDFLSLPGEIRTKIYKFLLRSSAVSQYADYNDDSTIDLNWRNRTQNRTRIDPTILCTCRRVAFEAWPILYTSNNLTFQAVEQMTAWLAETGLRNTQMVCVASIYTDLEGFKMNELEDVFKRCSGLRRLHVRASLLYCGPGYLQWSIRKFLRGAQFLLKDHPTLSRLMSKWNGGYEHQPTNSFMYPRIWEAVSVTFVASVDDGNPAIDGIVIDIEDAIEDAGVESANWRK